MSSQGSAVRKTQSSINFMNENNAETCVAKRQRTDTETPAMPELTVTNTDVDLLAFASTTNQ